MSFKRVLFIIILSLFNEFIFIWYQRHISRIFCKERGCKNYFCKDFKECRFSTYHHIKGGVNNEKNLSK